MSSPGSITIAHLSDLHLRASFPRRAELTREVLALPEVREADLVVVSGDVTDGGLSAQVDLASSVLDEVAAQGRLLVVPGNHDRSYRGLHATGLLNLVSANRHRVQESFSELSLRGGASCALGPGPGWPIRKDLRQGQCVVYGLDSTLGVGLDALAGGRLGPRQLACLADDLATLDNDQHLVLVLHHHVAPLLRGPWAVEQALSLADRRQLQILMRRYRAAAVLHGHRHRFLYRRVGDTMVISSPSTTLGCERTGRRFVLLLRIDLTTGGLTVHRRHLDREGHELEPVNIDGPGLVERPLRRWG